MDKEDVEGGRGREGREGKWFLGPEWGSHPQTLFLIKKSHPMVTAFRNEGVPRIGGHI